MSKKEAFDTVKVGEDLMKKLIDKVDFLDKQIIELVNIIDSRLAVVESKVGILPQENSSPNTRLN